MSETQIDPDWKETRRTLLVAFGLSAGFLLWGVFLFFTVGTKAQPAWDFGAVPDVPGLSVYSTVANRGLSSVPPYFLREQAELTPQHVQERPVIRETKKKESMP